MDNSNLFKVAEVQVVYTPIRNPQQMPQIARSSDAYDIFLEHWNPDHISLFEEFKVLLLNRANRVLGIFTASKGGIAGTIVDARLIFVAALKCTACSIVLAHSHPSGNLKPSTPDIELTRKLKSAGEFLDITVLDHMIITPYGYYSFADEGAL